MTSLTVSMPAYNEAENIAEMIDRVRQIVAPMVDDLEIIVVNDGSRDNTGEIVREISRQDPRVRLIEHPVNLGYGAAVRDGVWAATRDLIFFTDSDLQFDLSEIRRFLPRIAEADMVVGYRHSRSDPWFRRLFGHGWSWLVNLLFGYTARDIDCAYKLFKRQVVERVQVESGGAMFSAEFLIRAKHAGFTIVEEPVNHYPRIRGSQTGANPAVIARAFRELFRLRWKMWTESKDGRQRREQQA
ncbi:MAG TPA: glycosyltransferase family 2 protein [Chloroflexi bacterium]|nr:glycosyltransferase family 2 protein [Chloroflexota bacterium]